MPQQNQYLIRVTAKSVLVKHGTDMTRIRITTTPTNLYLDGQLLKDGPGMFTATKVGSMLKEVQQRLKKVVVNCNFDNWNVEKTATGFSVNRKRVKISYTSEKNEEVYHISEDDLMQDMLSDIDKDGK